ncbi:DUF1643 domain-containing protein [Alteribacillus bidgolensis]|uniref:DUF1643 domain-containing protein n=1 Tax=Alteribacillus bidgolensis TaxID=930129 RepID=A0A1G8FNW7_9BACI|nr:DUF1643 domain-containing protein [Alteribacillus bidgolensis]SDH83883.1 hypothetical protein SAMN05216352_10326 [Alteribacillus bidgolensis]
MPSRLWEPSEEVEAVFDHDRFGKRIYRYSLSCIWDDALEKAAFVMLNPSIADLDICDSTLGRCADYSKSWGYGGMFIVNLFAFIATYPKDLKKAVDPVGPDNDIHIVNVMKKSDKVIFAWGKQSGISERKKQVLHLLKEYDHFCIEKTKGGREPKHPLYLKKGLKPMQF